MRYLPRVGVGRRSALWIPLLGALFTVHVVASFSTSVAHCDRGSVGGSVLGISTVRLVLLAPTLAFIALALGVLTAATRTALDMRGSPGDPNGRRQFVAVVTATVAGLLVLYLAWALVVASAFPLC
jgi:hypothetical protein